MSEDPVRLASYEVKHVIHQAAQKREPPDPIFDSGFVSASIHLRLQPFADGQPRGAATVQIFLSPDHDALPLTTLRRSARSRLAQTLREMSAALDALPNEDGQDWSFD